MALIEFSQFTNGSAVQIGDTIVGLRGGVNTKFLFSAVLSVTGTANQITVSGTTAPIISIASNAILPGSAGVTLPGGNTAARAGAAGTIRFNSQTTELEATLDGATWVTLATTGGTVLSVSGTANRITSTGGVNPVIDIAATYVGQTSITTLGTIGTGVWQGTLVAGQYGGTGVANTGKTITIGGNFSMVGGFTFAGTLTGNTAVTFPTSGTLATTGGASIPSLVQGDTLYASAVNTLSALAKDTNATRYLSNTGASNNPAWAQVDLTNGVTGILPGANGGTGVNNGASLITIGGNFTMVGAFTFAGTLTGNTAVTFPTSGTLATTGGASIPSVVQGDLLYGSAANVLSTLAKDTNATRYLSNTGASNNPAWAQIDLTNGVTGILPGANGGTGVNNGASTITIGGSVTFSGAFTFTGTITGNTSVTFPTSGTLATTGGANIPSVVQGDLLYASATNVLSALNKDTNSTRYLSNTGATNNPAWAQVNLTNGVTGTLPVTSGGTGIASTVAYAPIVGGTTTTNPLQSVASAGTALQIFASGGAAALPSYKTWTVSQQIFGTPGTATYTAPAGLVVAYVECIGGGGGSGGAANSPAASTVSGGGGGAEWGATWLPAATIGVSQTVTVGAGGTAGSAGNNNGGAGGTSSFGALVTAVGGSAGNGAAAGTAGTPGAGGSGGTSGLSVSGEGAIIGTVFAATNTMYQSSGGGCGLYGKTINGSIINAGSTKASGSAASPGGGASGSYTSTNAGDQAGAAGAAGAVIVTEYRLT